MKVARLFDVSPVTFPATPDTTVALREMRARFGDSAGVPISTLRRRMQLAEVDGSIRHHAGSILLRKRIELTERALLSCRNPSY